MINANHNRAHSIPSTTLLLSGPDAAKALGISDRTLYSYTKAGLIRCVYLPSTGQTQPNKLKRYEVSELQRFIDAQRTEAIKDKDPADLISSVAVR